MISGLNFLWSHISDPLMTRFVRQGQLFLIPQKLSFHLHDIKD